MFSFDETFIIIVTCGNQAGLGEFSASSYRASHREPRNASSYRVPHREPRNASSYRASHREPRSASSYELVDRSGLGEFAFFGTSSIKCFFAISKALFPVVLIFSFDETFIIRLLHLWQSSRTR